MKTLFLAIAATLFSMSAYAVILPPTGGSPATTSPATQGPMVRTIGNCTAASGSAVCAMAGGAWSEGQFTCFGVVGNLCATSSGNHVPSGSFSYTCTSGTYQGFSSQYGGHYCLTPAVPATCQPGFTLVPEGCYRPDLQPGQEYNPITGEPQPAPVGNQTRNPITGVPEYPTVPAEGSASPRDGEYVQVTPQAFMAGEAQDPETGGILKLTGGMCTGEGANMKCYRVVDGYTGKASQPEGALQWRNADGSFPPVGTSVGNMQLTTPQEQLILNQGKIPLTINGVTTAVTPTQSVSTSTRVVTNNDGSTSNIRENININCVGSNCNSTKTITTSTQSSGGGAPVITTATEQTKANTSSFCLDNPSSPICKAENDECKRNPERLSCKSLGPVADQPDLEKKTIGLSSVTPVAVSGSGGSCPVDTPLPKGLSLSWQPLCDTASGVKPVIVALAWLMAAYIIFGVGSTKET